jgi:elongation factor 3
MRDGRLEASGHNWVDGQGSGPRIDNKAVDEEQFDAMGNKIDTKKTKKLTSSEARKVRVPPHFYIFYILWHFSTAQKGAHVS